MIDMSSCPICDSSSEKVVTLLIRGKYTGEYWRCTSCMFMFAQNPEWLAGSFTEELNDLDIGSVDRCLLVADFITPLISSVRTISRVLDWGGGYGLLTRLLRDRGIDCLTYDPFVKPILAKGAVAEHLADFDLVVVSEVMLHMTNPLEILRDLLRMASVVVFTGVVPPKDLDDDWWYLMPDTGQHVSFFSEKSVVRMGEILGCSAYSDGKFFHVLTNQKLNFLSKMFIRHPALALSYSWILSGVRYAQRAIGGTSSLLQDDQAQAVSSLPWRINPKDTH